MSPYGYFIMMDFVLHHFHIYYGDLNDPSTWTHKGHSFAACSDAEDKLMELQQQPDQPLTNT